MNPLTDFTATGVQYAGEPAEGVAYIGARRRTAEEKREEKESAVCTFYFDYTYMTDNGRWLKHEEPEEARKTYKNNSQTDIR